MRTGQKLLHDVGVINLPTSAEAIFVVIQLFIFFYLHCKKLSLGGASPWKPALLTDTASLGEKKLESRQIREQAIPRDPKTAPEVVGRKLGCSRRDTYKGGCLLLTGTQKHARPWLPQSYTPLGLAKSPFLSASQLPLADIQA